MWKARDGEEGGRNWELEKSEKGERRRAEKGTSPG